jgi:hypothetical protein
MSLAFHCHILTDSPSRASMNRPGSYSFSNSYTYHRRIRKGETRAKNVRIIKEDRPDAGNSVLNAIAEESIPILINIVMCISGCKREDKYYR